MTDVRLAWAYLSRVAEAPCAALAALVGCVGPVEAAERVRRGAASAELKQLTSARRDVDRAAEDLDRVARLGGRLVTPTQFKTYVTRLRRMADRQRLTLAKSRRRDPRAYDFGRWTLTDQDSGKVVVAGTLTQCHAWLVR